MKLTAPASTLSKREQDCLAAIESLTSKGWPARTVDIAHSLDVKAPSAVEIVENLRAKQVVEKGPGGVKTTKLGARVLSQMHRSHRLLETMFTQMGMPQDEACKESKQLDKYASREVIQAICSYLGHPRLCPDRQPIAPDPECCKTVPK